MLAFDPRVPAVNANPFPALANLRRTDAVHHSPILKGWVVTRYDDVKSILLNSKLYSVDRIRPFLDHLPPERARQLPELSRLIPLWVAFREPPDHTRIRRVVNVSFTPQAIGAMQSKIVELVDDLIDGFIERGHADLIADFALPLPGSVILDMLGAPRSDLKMVKAWSDDLELFIGGAKITPDKYQRAEHGTLKMADYFRDVIRRRRDKPGTDVISLLTSAADAEGRISEDELVATCILFLFGGHETTTNLIGNGMHALLRNPEQLKKVKDDPSLAPKLVEECLRYDGPGGAVVRIVTEDHELRGKTLRKGERVFAMVQAANRDPERFANPDSFEIERSDNQHLTFGQGPHFCAGAPLARAEAKVAFPRLLERLQDLELAQDDLQWRDAIIMRGLRSLPLRFKPGSRLSASS